MGMSDSISMAGPSGESELRLPPILDLRAAAPLAAELLSRRGRPLEIDASDVEQIGGQCLQILLSASATWRNDGASLDVGATSAAFESGIQLLGVSLCALSHKETVA